MIKWRLHMLGFWISCQSLGANGEMGYGILKFSAYYDIAKFSGDQSD